jgi:hypothetical protein
MAWRRTSHSVVHKKPEKATIGITNLFHSIFRRSLKKILRRLRLKKELRG